MKKMYDVIFSYHKLARRLEARPDEKEKVYEYLQEMVSNYNEKLLKQCKKFLDLTIWKFYDDIDFSVPKDINFKEILKENFVVFVPNHQSHADYIILSYVLYHHYKISNFIAGGVNLDIFPIGPLFRRAGCFFIRRSFNNNTVYKLTLEAYIYYLLVTSRPLEFFYEGGRSRSGELLNPKFGFFQILLEIYSSMKESDRKPLLFFPVSIVHEIVPEGKSLAREISGHKKKKESTLELLKLYKIFSKKFGQMHIKINHPIKINNHISDDNLKFFTKKLAFNCHKMVARTMPITPTSLLAMIFLKRKCRQLIPLEDILKEGAQTFNYFKNLEIPLSSSLKDETLKDSLLKTLKTFVKNNKIKNKQGLYFIEEESLQEISYYINSILHHFWPFAIISWILKAISIKEVKNYKELFSFYKDLRNEFKEQSHFYTVRDIFNKTQNIFIKSLGYKVNKINDLFCLKNEDLLIVIEFVRPCAKMLHSAVKKNYLALKTLNHFTDIEFTMNQFIEKAQNGPFFCADIEKSLNTYLQKNLITFQNNKYFVIDSKTVKSNLNKYIIEINDYDM